MDKPTGWLGIVAKRHKEWINIVKSFGEYDFAEDIVQEAYLTIYKYANEDKIIRNGIVSRGYMYFTLRSLYYQYYNSKRNITKLSIDDEEYTYQIEDDSEMDEQIAFNKICMLIDDHIDNWRWYEKKLFTLYRDSDLSIRGIANETNISWVSIFNTLKHAKNELKENFSETWEDYQNQDYDRI
jgi:DNA-directed RNA polymerase specialized sigma24 family protein